RIQQQFDAFAGGHLAALMVAFNVLGPATGQRLGVLGLDLGELGPHRLGGLEVGGRMRVECRLHDWNPNVLAANAVRISLVPPPIPRMRMSRYCLSISDSAM